MPSPLAAARLVAVVALTTVVTAQVPNPNRSVHPAIADPSTAVRYGSAPLLQYPDGQWNHGEGFADGPDADRGGWHENDDGMAVTAADVHTPDGWLPFTWQSATHPAAPVALLRLPGYLRPAGLPLPDTHPLYGPLGRTYVDQGAFEVFRPVAARLPNQKILLVIQCLPTLPFPRDRAGRYLIWEQIYRGFFSPDGLVRDEPVTGVRDAATFLGNADPATVQRPSLTLLASWQPNSDYWPLLAYPVMSVPFRQTTLNEQRYLQLLRGLERILAENSPRNPLGAALLPQQLEHDVVTVFVGGSNGGHQASWSLLRYPRRVHGAFAEVINPSIQRLFGEHDLGYAVAWLSGDSARGAEVTEFDYLNWGQYAWSQGVEIHDLSYLRQFLRGRTYRPIGFLVGDEDITSTGTDWVRVLEGNAWQPAGVRDNPGSFGEPTQSQFAWTVAEKACHAVGFAVDPYHLGTPPQLDGEDFAHATFAQALAQRASELAGGTPPPATGVAHEPRTSQLRGLDDPHEWCFGRLGEQLPPNSADAPLQRDDAFFAATQPGAAGTRLGHREALMIRDGRVYVGSAEGIVSAFAVAVDEPLQPLVRVAQSQPLGHAAFALAALDEPGGGWSLVVGTRRHLHRLDPKTLAPRQAPVLLPWEVAEPHGLQVGDVLPGHPGPEVVFASLHGGLVFCGTDLAPFHEWPEPGIVDFQLTGPFVTLVSRRGVIANVTFDAADVATLRAVSQPIPRRLREHVTTPDPWLDSPCQGVPIDLATMQLDLGALGKVPLFVSLWDGDEDGLAVRAYQPDTLQRVPILIGDAGDLRRQVLAGGRGGNDLATCRAPAGDHLVVLASDSLLLLDQFGGLVGRKSLTTTTQGYLPFGSQAEAIAVGDLVPNAAPYREQVVVATQSGALLWLHVQDLALPGVTLPAPAPIGGQPQPGHWLTVARDAGDAAPTAVQPRTNRALSATWGMARRPGDSELHLLDQRGGYWRVTAGGTVRLQERLATAGGARGWSWLGGEPLSSGTFGPRSTQASVLQGAFEGIVVTAPWTPIDGANVAYEFTSRYIPFNWLRPVSFGARFFAGFAVHPLGGSTLADADGAESWAWTNRVPDWGDFVEGLRFGRGGSPTTLGLTGIWASTRLPATVVGDRGDHVPFLDLRSFVTFVPAMAQQAAHAVRLDDGSSAIVLGCPGGRVRVLQPGKLRRDDGSPHELGRFTSTSADFGWGGSALAVRHEHDAGGERLRIWLGTLYDPTARPAHYTDAEGVLGDGEVAAGGVHMVTWTAAGGCSAPLHERTFLPVAGERGALGVVGLVVADLLPQSPGDELVVGTVSGDLLVLQADTLATIWRTHVPGAIGFYNALRVDDLDGDGRKELYAAGSFGLWRFTVTGA